jgi:hypothetical protein
VIQAMKKSLALTSSMLCMIGLVVGCRTTRFYDGDARPKDQVAVIQPSGIAPFQRVSVAGVDGRTSQLLSRDVEVLPGGHEVEILMEQGNSWARNSVFFDAQAGHVYQVKAAGAIVSVPGSTKIRFWIVDLETGAEVGSVGP